MRTGIPTETVLVELVQVVSSKVLYRFPRSETRRHLSSIILLRGVKLPRKGRYLRALELYEAHPRLPFVDALLATYAEETPPATVLSFDQGFDRVPGLTRDEP